MASLVVRNAEKTVRGIKVLDGISLACHPGTVTGLCGANGSGKTMLMRAMIGLMYLDKGSVECGGLKLGKDIDFLPSVGLLIENPAFLDGYTAVENLLYVARLRGGVSQDEAKRCVAYVGLDPADRRRFRQFSLGMKQRLGIAAAILGDPDVVVLDEPTNALDEMGCDLLRDIARNIRSRGAIGVIASHDAGMLKQVSDEIVRLRDGKVIQRMARRPPECAAPQPTSSLGAGTGGES